jgi:hypothetical protein
MFTKARSWRITCKVRNAGAAVRLIEGDGVAAGETVAMFKRMRNKAGREYVLVRLASDASDTLQWVASAHVTSLPALPSGARHDPRRSLEKDLERRSVSPSQSPREFRAVRAEFHMDHESFVLQNLRFRTL